MDAASINKAKAEAQLKVSAVLISTANKMRKEAKETYDAVKDELTTFESSISTVDFKVANAELAAIELKMANPGKDVDAWKTLAARRFSAVGLTYDLWNTS